MFMNVSMGVLVCYLFVSAMIGSSVCVCMKSRTISLTIPKLR